MSSVDVIVPCYRYGDFLRACVESVLNQQTSDLRILIIDDASPDNTAEVAAELMKGDHRVEFLRHRKNIGHLATYNEGLEWVSAEYMLLLSADDVVLPGALIRAAEVMDGHPEVGMTFGRVIYFPAGFAVSQFSEGKVPIRPASFQKAAAIIDDSAEARDFVETHAGPAAARGGSFIEGPFGATDLGYRILGTAEFMRSCRHSNQVHTATAIVRSAVQKSIGGYRKELPHAGDMEMWLRFAVHAPVAYIDSYQAASRVHGNNMSVGYYEKTIVDLQQRKLLLDIIFNQYADLIEHRDELATQMYRGLSEACIRAAGVPFSMGNGAACDEILSLARQVYAPIRNSLLWKCFAIKRALGPRMWAIMGSALRPVAHRVFGFGS